MTNDINELEEILPDISLELAEQFRAYFELIEQYNTRINLIAKGTVSRAVVKHFSDSYYGISLIKKEFIPEKPIFDFGSGNGFPGLIAAMMLPEFTVILVERDQRKAEFLKTAAHKLGLKNVEIHPGSTSDLAEGSCHNVISRAMAPLPKFLLKARPMLAPGGSAFLFKGDHWSTEFGSTPAQLFAFWDVELLDSYELPKNDGTRYMIQCRRV